jgi:hypothetical protein
LANAVLPGDQRTSPQALSIPPAIGSDLYTNASGFFKAAHGDSTEGDLGCYTTAFRFLVKHNTGDPPRRAFPASTYRWEKLGFVTFHPSAKFFTILCLDIGDDARAHLCRQIPKSKLAVLEAHPLSIHLLVLRHTLESLDRAVWSWRDVARGLATLRRLETSITCTILPDI